MADAVVPPTFTNRHTYSVFTEAARAVHGQPDLNGLCEWVASAMVRLAAPGTSAAFCLLSRDGEAVWFPATASDINFPTMGDPREVPLFETVIQGEAVLRLSDLGGSRRLAERLPRSLAAGSLLILPVVGQAFHGVVFLGHPEPGQLDEETEALLLALTAHLGVALDNLATVHKLEELQRTQKEVVQQLEEAVRPPVPLVPHTELGVHYEPAEQLAPTGGDLHDWLMLPNGDLHVAIVDVMGKGVAATKDALAVTHALRLLVLEGCPLERVVARADALVTNENPDLVATLMVARYNPSTGLLQLAGAGHPPALIVSGDTVQEVAAPGIPIGWPGAGSHQMVEFTMQRSDTLILYTDGLIEATKDILFGLESLAVAAREIGDYPARRMAPILVDRALRGAARRDDSLAVVLRRRTPPPPTGQHVLGPFEYRFSPSLASIPLARHLLSDWLERLPVEEPEIVHLLLVASELCSNAVRHATGSPGGVVLRAWAEGDAVVIEVENDGDDFELPETSEDPPAPDAEQGRGLFLVHAFVDDVEKEAGRPILRARKRAVISAPAPGETPLRTPA